MPRGVYKHYSHQVFQKGHKHSKEVIEKLRNRHKEKNPHWKGGDGGYWSQVANAIYREHHTNIICEKCSNPKQIVIHHKNRNTKDNRLINLQPLCRACHMKLHFPEIQKNNPHMKAHIQEDL